MLSRFGRVAINTGVRGFATTNANQVNLKNMLNFSKVIKNDPQKCVYVIDSEKKIYRL